MTIASTGDSKVGEFKLGTDIQPPSNVSITDDTIEDELSLGWDSVSEADGYRVYRATTSGSVVSDYTQVADVTTTSHTDTGLEDGERYYYRVTSYSSSESSVSSQVNATTVLSAPSSLASSGEELSWTLNDDSVDGSVKVRRSADGGSTWSEIASLAYDATAYTDTSAADDATYLYEIERDTTHTAALSSTVTLSARKPTSHAKQITSSATRLVTLVASPSSYTAKTVSSASRQVSLVAATQSYVSNITSSASRSSTVYANRTPESYVSPVSSFAYNERTSLELISQNVEWDEDGTFWYTDWFTESIITGREDELALKYKITPDAKDPTAIIVVEYDGTGDGTVDDESEPVLVTRRERLAEVNDIVTDPDGHYRLKISEYSGYNSLYHIDFGIIH
jgi:hypothetical protein